jgi:hypothetical protein
MLLFIRGIFIIMLWLLYIQNFSTEDPCWHIGLEFNEFIPGRNDPCIILSGFLKSVCVRSQGPMARR